MPGRLPSSGLNSRPIYTFDTYLCRTPNHNMVTDESQCVQLGELLSKTLRTKGVFLHQMVEPSKVEGVSSTQLGDRAHASIVAGL